MQNSNDIVFRLNEDIELPTFNILCKNDELSSIFSLLELLVVITRQEKVELLFVLLGIVLYILPIKNRFGEPFFLEAFAYAAFLEVRS